MKLTQLNAVNNFTNMNKITNSSESSKVTNAQDLSKKVNSDIVDVSLQNKSNNSFVNNISSNITQIAQLQKMQSNISNQLEISTKIVHITKQTAEASQIKLDEKQPQINELLTKYNLISTKNEDFEKEGIFFDGRLGAKPLSSKEILDAVTQQTQKLEQKQLNVNKEIHSLISNTQKDIQVEKNSVETKVEFKNIDYDQESSQFNANTLNSIKGGIIPSQANGFPVHSEKLLA